MTFHDDDPNDMVKDLSRNDDALLLLICNKESVFLLLALICPTTSKKACVVRLNSMLMFQRVVGEIISHICVTGYFNDPFGSFV